MAADNKGDMAAPRHPVSPASRRPAPAGAGGQLPAAPQKPAKADPNKPLKNARAGESDTPQSYFRRFGNFEDHTYFVHLIGEAFLAKQVGKNALRLAKAWSHFMQAAMGLRVTRSPGNVQPETGETPDVGDRDLKSMAGNVDRGSFAYDNPFADHYATIAAQMQRGAAATYSS